LSGKSTCLSNNSCKNNKKIHWIRNPWWSDRSMAEAKKPPPLPVMLELAPLPREQIGPFLLLGVEKSATAEDIEAAWARRLIWARKKQIKVALEDINWAREVLNDPERRVAADAASLNLDTVDGVLRRLECKYESAGTGNSCRPIDEERPPTPSGVSVDIPDPAAVGQTIAIPEVPREFPVARFLLEELARKPLDPWELIEE
jgi:hypothetical protein